MRGRTLSVDLLRGLTIAAMIRVNNPGTWSHIYAPPEHADWHGYLYQTIFVHDVLHDRLSSLLYALVLIVIYLALGTFPYRWGVFFKV